MRIILVITTIFLSCNPNRPNTELYFSNSYQFVRTCKLNLGEIKLPYSFTLTDSEYKPLVTNMKLKNDAAELNLIYDCNAAELDLQELHLLFPSISNVIEDLHTNKEKIIAGKISSHQYIYIFPIASGYCNINFNFKNHLSESDCQRLFNDYIHNIIIKSCDNYPIKIEESARSYEIISKDNKNLSITDKSVFGDFYLSAKTKDLVFKSKQNLSFTNCDQLLAYFNEMIIPFYSELENGSLFSIIKDDSIIKKKKDKEILMQFIVRKNSNPNNTVGFTEKLIPVYVNEEISIENKYAVEH